MEKRDYTFLLEVTMESQPLRSSDIRERNEKIILGLIRSRKALSQSEAVQLTGLRAPTVFRIFSKLEQLGFIRTTGTPADGEDRRGRKPQFYQVVPDSSFAVGVDFWAGSASITVCDFAGTVIFTNERGLPPALNATGLLDQLITLIERAYRESGLVSDRVLGFGIGAPGRIDLAGGKILKYPRIAGLDNFPLGQHISERFGIPVYLHNNASLIAVAEQRYGAAAEYRSLLALLVRSGVGGAYLEDGKPFTTLSRSAIELGHMCLDCDGPACSCGERGCLEAYISEEGILSFVPEGYAVSSFSDFEIVLAGHRDELRSALGEPLRILERAVRNLYTLFAPECFLVISRSALYADLLASHLRENIADLPRVDGSPVRVISDCYDAARIGRGAADLVFDRFLS